MHNDLKDDKPEVNDLISLRQAADFCGLSQTHLRLLVRNKIIWGIKIDTIWLTTKNAVSKYIEIDRRTGPKIKNT
jgi:hypothetical protein